MDINVITKVPIVNIAATDAVRLASGIASHHPKLDGVTHAFRWFRSDGMAETPQDGTQKVVIRRYTSKQMGDACEMLVAAELTLAGIPALTVPDNWPGYDVIAQPFDGEPLRISVKSRTFRRGSAFVEYNIEDKFDWLAIVLLPGDGELKRRVYLIPRQFADRIARKNKPTTKHASQRYWSIQEIPKLFTDFEANFILSLTGLST